MFSVCGVMTDAVIWLVVFQSISDVCQYCVVVGTKVCLYCQCHEKFKDFFPWKMVSCFAMMFVLLWKFLAMNIIQISGACSLIHQK